MKPLPLITIGLVALIAAAPGAASTPVSVPQFDSINLKGGGHVVVRHGAVQGVTLVSGNLETTRFKVTHDGTLEIDACVRSCSNYRLEVEIVTPGLEGVGVEGGGEIRADGAFPDRDSLAIGIEGGGEIDMIAISAGAVAAGIEGGGTILASARDRLVAGIEGGGTIRYRGDPTVTSGIEGGGSVSRIGE
jgi:hypothetical protein